MDAGGYDIEVVPYLVRKIFQQVWAENFDGPVHFIPVGEDVHTAGAPFIQSTRFHAARQFHNHVCYAAYARRKQTERVFLCRTRMAAEPSISAR